MFYVPDDTKVCGFYQCKECGERFLDVKIAPFMVCPYCEEEEDMELGPLLLHLLSLLLTAHFL